MKWLRADVAARWRAGSGRAQSNGRRRGSWPLAAGGERGVVGGGCAKGVRACNGGGGVCTSPGGGRQWEGRRRRALTEPRADGDAVVRALTVRLKRLDGAAVCVPVSWAVCYCMQRGVCRAEAPVGQSRVACAAPSSAVQPAHCPPARAPPGLDAGHLLAAHPRPITNCHPITARHRLRRRGSRASTTAETAALPTLVRVAAPSQRDPAPHTQQGMPPAAWTNTAASTAAEQAHDTVDA